MIIQKWSLLVEWSDSIITGTLQSLLPLFSGYNNTIQAKEQTQMTTWAIQPSDYGNEVKIWADVFDNDHFADAKRHAERQAEQLGRPVTIWKVGSISEFKWMEVK